MLCLPGWSRALLASAAGLPGLEGVRLSQGACPWAALKLRAELPRGSRRVARASLSEGGLGRRGCTCFPHGLCLPPGCSVASGLEGRVGFSGCYFLLTR